MTADAVPSADGFKQLRVRNKGLSVLRRGSGTGGQLGGHSLCLDGGTQNPHDLNTTGGLSSYVLQSISCPSKKKERKKKLKMQSSKDDKNRERNKEQR